MKKNKSYLVVLSQLGMRFRLLQKMKDEFKMTDGFHYFMIMLMTCDADFFTVKKIAKNNKEFFDNNNSVS